MQIEHGSATFALNPTLDLIQWDFRLCCTSDRKNNPNTSTSAPACCENIVSAREMYGAVSAPRADTHCTLDRPAEKGGIMRRARAIRWVGGAGVDKILWAAEERKTAGESDLSKSFFPPTCSAVEPPLLLRQLTDVTVRTLTCIFTHTHRLLVEKY